ncbi:MAG: glycogen debranching enzyme family protein [Candidatus Bathyarchaeota archaeon]|nr:MAG: glycogen debranching enzyme family protein [Candidatus Bathyarchaeota archaeon]
MENGFSELKFEKNILSNLENAMHLEWIITNGLGGYASSNILGINTRKYHGILIASFNPPSDRRVMLSKLDEQIFIDSEAYAFGANEFNGVIYPQGYKYLKSFSRFPFPTYAYNIPGVKLQKSILMPNERNAAVVIYEISTPPKKKIRFEISPLINSRHFHAVTNKDMVEWDVAQRVFSKGTKIETLQPKSTLILSSNLGQYSSTDSKWIERIFLRLDNSQGYSCYDDCYVPGKFIVNVKGGKAKFYVMAIAEMNRENAEKSQSTVSRDLSDLDSFQQREYDRVKTLLVQFRRQHPNLIQKDWLKFLIYASDSFIVKRNSTKTKTVIAGYHWFEDWGRDSLISLPGLTLITGRIEDARKILLTFKRHCNQGIIPNHFPDKTGEAPTYNTVDATLWYFNAVLQYLKYTNDFDFVKNKLWKMLESVINFHIQGTINNISLDNDGLIMHGPQLTWMDAAMDNNPITPREGKAVEIQSLWYNALRTMELLATYFKHDDLTEKYQKLAEDAKTSFLREFWNPDRNYLFDVIKNEYKDASLRPNQVLAVSLDFSMLDKEKQTAIVSTVHEHLWTIYGLRTLSTRNPKYHGKYSGNWIERNNAYHNGTAWAWLIGPFVTAYLRTKDYDAEWRKYAFQKFLQPLFGDHILNAGIGTVSEVFDGNYPHSPSGCISQAWSIAEPLRAYIEDVIFERPMFEAQVLEILSSR